MSRAARRMIGMTTAKRAYYLGTASLAFLVAPIALALPALADTCGPGLVGISPVNLCPAVPPQPAHSASPSPTAPASPPGPSTAPGVVVHPIPAGTRAPLPPRTTQTAAAPAPGRGSPDNGGGTAMPPAAVPAASGTAAAPTTPAAAAADYEDAVVSQAPAERGYGSRAGAYLLTLGGLLMTVSAAFGLKRSGRG